MAITTAQNEPNASMDFKVERPLPSPYDPDTWEYLIHDGNYARHVFGIGWVWNKCSKNIREKRPNNIIAPEVLQK